MPTHSLTIDWAILSNVGVEAATERRDGLALESGVMKASEALTGKGTKKWTSGGRYPVSVSMYAPTGITPFSDGYEEFDNTVNEPERVAYYSPAVSGLLLKIGINETYIYGSTTAGLKNKVKSLVSSGMGFLHRSWTQRIVSGLGSGFTGWIGWNGFDSSAGVFERPAAGSQVNTIGGLSKSTYSFAPAWSNRVVNMNNAFASNSHGLYQAVVATRRHKAGGKKAWLFSDAGMTNQKRTVSANERYYSKDDLDAGRPVEKFHGYNIYQEPQMPVSTATGGSTTNTYPITAYLVDFEDIFFAWMKRVQMDDGLVIPDGYFGVGDWRQVSGMQSVYGMPMYVAGQTIVADMGSSAVIYGGETY